MNHQKFTEPGTTVELRIKKVFWNKTLLRLIVSAFYFSLIASSLAQPRSYAGSEAESHERLKRFHQLSKELKLDLSDGAYLNSLIFSDSLYLLKHATNPIGWQQWSVNALEQAKSNNKLIFISVGFMACYWCQEMERFSFRDENVAKILNENYVAIKIDREVLPAIDAFLTRALTQLKGTSGWPINAVLTPDADLIFIDSYLEREDLLNVILGMANEWKNSPQNLIRKGKLFNSILTVVPESNTTAELGSQDYDFLNSQLLMQLDYKYGGLKGSPKFPEPAMLMFLVKSLLTKNEAKLMEVLIKQLDNMSSRGLYDPIYGGFHRYVSDESWSIPHYEKMLYTQALLLEVYSLAYRLKPDPVYKNVVQGIVNFLMTFLQNEEGSYFGSLDAVYDSIEGGFYLYSERELSKLTSLPINASFLKLYQKDNFFGFHVIQPFPESFDLLRKELSTLRVKEDLTVDKKIITSWNALLISGFASAYLSFGDEVYKTLALETAQALEKQLLSGRQLYRVNYRGNLSTEATLEDYAYLIRAYLDIYDIYNDDHWLKLSEKLINESVHQLYKPDLGFTFSGNQQLISMTEKLQDGELLNPWAVMLENLKRFKLRRKNDKYIEIRSHLEEILRAGLRRGVMGQFYNALTLSKKLSLLSPVQFFANGNGRVQLKSQVDGSYLLIFNMKYGWHINSNVPLTKELIPTSVTAPELPGIHVYYPDAAITVFGESNKEISVFEDTFTLILKSASGQVSLELQACSTTENVCLLPETIDFYLPEN